MIVERSQYKRCIKLYLCSGLSSVSDHEGTVDNKHFFLSPKQSVPKGYEGGGVKGTDEDEQQEVETHHDGKMVSEEPGGAAGTSGQVLPLRVHEQVLDSQKLIVGDYKVVLRYVASFAVLCS